ncbi:MAG: DUF445 domain-containing protein [Anaerovibrio sp.]|uniref:DUF445 domain-containing protein n=1 Tax=Anaerovibrio sp. TaxID=1872532 RepID=UPI0025EA6B32|nr:DUF445 domain-containing protein [Anaerovibrio sp.]MCR5176566.1 DUF445 domain-containing protein [Anaerovibrio sp.]
MIWHNWNKADKTLLGAAAIFLFALCLHIQYPQNIFADGILFCAEAALVGGIADWFAVTALFRKPLGFPYHTAILPRRREAFAKATGRMLQNEFFSRKKLLKKAKSIDYAGKIKTWLADSANRATVAKWLQGVLIQHSDAWKNAIGDNLTQWIDDDAFGSTLLEKIRSELKYDSIATGILDTLVQRAQPFVSGNEFKVMLFGYLEQYRDEKLDSPFVKMMAGAAEATNIINLEEATELTIAQSQKILGLLEQEGAEERQVFISALSDLVKLSLNNESCQQDFIGMWSNGTKGGFSVSKAVSDIDISEDNKTGELIYGFAAVLVDSIYRVLGNNQRLVETINDTVYQITGRGALQAQEMLGDIACDVIGSLTDDQMNHLVYDKAEPDLLWIRMNGSIVGALIGLSIFVISCVFSGRIC